MPAKPKSTKGNDANNLASRGCTNRLVVGASDTPESSAAWHDCIAWLNQRDEREDPHHVALANLAEKLERERNEARQIAHLWQERWMNDTPLEECNGTLMPWMIGWKDSSDNVEGDLSAPGANSTTK
jgi:hypothetical protein